MQREGSAFGWKTCLTIGCSILLVVGLVIGVVVALNWTKFSTVVSEATATAQGLWDVQSAVRAHTGASDVKVHASSGTGVDDKTLRIEIAGGTLLDDADPGSPDARRNALAVAVVARDALPVGMSFARYEIVKTATLKVGVHVSRSQRHVFPIEELPPPAPR